MLVTRPRGQADQFIRQLKSLGALTICAPAISIAPPQDPAQLSDLPDQISQFDWIIFTSVNGVAAIRSLGPLGLAEETRIAAIGPATAQAAFQLFGREVSMPRDYVAEAIPSVLGEVDGLRILLPRADIARPELAHLLRNEGAKVTEIAAYRILDAQLEPIAVKPDYITVTSSSAVRSTVKRLLAEDRTEWLKSVQWVCIGPITAAAAEKLDCNVAGTADKYTIDGLIAKLVELNSESVRA